MSAPTADPHHTGPIPADSLDPRALAGLIDHTLLKPEATGDAIRVLCADGRAHGFAAVCVNPVWVALCAEELRGYPTRVASVAGFPLGASLPGIKAAEARRSVDDGACEIDMVLNVGALKSGDDGLVEDDIAAVVDACPGIVVKVIIEAALLTDDEKVRACTLSQQAGAGFVKTSTGFGPGGATTRDVALMRRTVGARTGVKAAGGVRDWTFARELIAAGANRIGTSSGVRILEEFRAAAARG
ncbi:MAG: deoxyribose-phosphate aldolase [Acidobacteria bacterium]|jgi:deoxyribose-phosphate aldolase|nr:deoxyribose-phosphate aldolase [Acidobacteriota bacterium]